MLTEFVFWLVVVLVGLFAAGLTVATAFNRRGKGYYLCEDCRFNSPRDCLKKERPYALICTSYRVIESEPISVESAKVEPQIPQDEVSSNSQT